MPLKKNPNSITQQSDSILFRIAKFIKNLLNSKKKIILVGFALLVLFALYNLVNKNKMTTQASNFKPLIESVNKSFNFPALTNQGKITSGKIKLTITNVEKTNQVLVSGKIYPALNNKMFLIVNFELKNDNSQNLNIAPGDLVRLMIDSDKENKFAPDLHNNMVAVAPISTKIDRIGFVIPKNENKFTLFVGELEGKKEEIPIVFPN